jgi:hypothetical protein
MTKVLRVVRMLIYNYLVSPPELGGVSRHVGVEWSVNLNQVTLNTKHSLSTQVTLSTPNPRHLL